MTLSRTIAMIAAAIAPALFASGCNNSGHPGQPVDDAELDRIERRDCLQYVDETKDPDLVKQCLVKKQLPPDRIAAANAIIEKAAKERAGAIDKLGHADPAVLAMMKKWAAAKAADPTIFVGISVNTPDPVPLMYGGTFASGIAQGAIANDLESWAKDKLPGVGFSNGDRCEKDAPELDFAVTYAVRDSGDVDTIQHGSDTVGVHVLAYDFDIVACYGGERAVVASVKDRKFPLPEGYTEQSDAGSAGYIAMRDMDRHAASFVEGTIQAALGL